MQQLSPSSRIRSCISRSLAMIVSACQLNNIHTYSIFISCSTWRGSCLYCLMDQTALPSSDLNFIFPSFYFKVNHGIQRLPRLESIMESRDEVIYVIEHEVSNSICNKNFSKLRVFKGNGCGRLRNFL